MEELDNELEILLEIGNKNEEWNIGKDWLFKRK